jgi:hypothetical protein
MVGKIMRYKFNALTTEILEFFLKPEIKIRHIQLELEKLLKEKTNGTEI